MNLKMCFFGLITINFTISINSKSFFESEMAAARRAAARAAAAAAEAPQPPALEPTPETETETNDPEKTTEKASADGGELKEGLAHEATQKDCGITERVIERIIICPGMPNPYMGATPPPPQGHCHCPPQPVVCTKKRKSRGKKGKGEDGLCKHPFCIVQRSKVKPQGLPWASGLYMHQQKPGQPEEKQPPVVICQRPVICCCHKCNPPPSESSCSEDEEDPPKDNTEQFMTFMNMVFAAANVINERPDVF